MRTIKFKTMPYPVAEQLQDKLDGALQIIAALVLTDDEMIEIKLKQDPEARKENLKGWVTMMKKDLLSRAGRAQLVQVLRSHEILNNTHRAYPLSRLLDGMSNTYALSQAYEQLEEMLVTYAEGGAGYSKGDKWDGDAYRDYWVAKLREKGVCQQVAEWVMQHDGLMLALEAGMERTMRPIREEDAKVLAAQVVGMFSDECAAYSAGWATYGDVRKEIPAEFAHAPLLEKYTQGIAAAKAQVAVRMARRNVPVTGGTK